MFLNKQSTSHYFSRKDRYSFDKNRYSLTLFNRNAIIWITAILRRNIQ